jgi:hypothetical protein
MFVLLSFLKGSFERSVTLLPTMFEGLRMRRPQAFWDLFVTNTTEYLAGERLRNSGSYLRRYTFILCVFAMSFSLDVLNPRLVTENESATNCAAVMASILASQFTAMFFTG